MPYHAGQGKAAAHEEDSAAADCSYGYATFPGPMTQKIPGNDGCLRIEEQSISHQDLRKHNTSYTERTEDTHRRNTPQADTWESIISCAYGWP